jgi:hypothetical protein
MNEPQKEKLENLQMQKLVEQNSSLIQCSCNNIIEMLEGRVDLCSKDDAGNKLTQEAAIHMSKNRIRCNKCEKNFCAGCS